MLHLLQIWFTTFMHVYARSLKNNDPCYFLWFSTLENVMNHLWIKSLVQALLMPCKRFVVTWAELCYVPYESLDTLLLTCFFFVIRGLFALHFSYLEFKMHMHWTLLTFWVGVGVGVGVGDKRGGCGRSSVKMTFYQVRTSHCEDKIDGRWLSAKLQ